MGCFRTLARGYIDCEDYIYGVERVVTVKAAEVGRSPRRRQVWRGLALLGLLVALGSPARADDDGWVLTQKSAMFGDQYVYLTKNGMKCYNPKVGFAFV